MSNRTSSKSPASLKRKIKHDCNNHPKRLRYIASVLSKDFEDSMSTYMGNLAALFTRIREKPNKKDFCMKWRVNEDDMERVFIKEVKHLEDSRRKQQTLTDRALHEARVLARVEDLKRRGLWSIKLLPKVKEASRERSHWDFLLGEMRWMASDFSQERHWKVVASRKFAKTCAKRINNSEHTKDRNDKAELHKLRRLATEQARMIKGFWTGIDKVVKHLSTSQEESVKKKTINHHLNMLVDQTEQYSSLLSGGFLQNSDEGLIPTGFTLTTSEVSIRHPLLLRHQLREYQMIGLNWMVTLHKNKLNGILADEMGLGKTIQTIALLAHLAYEEGIWGPHLIVVPTSVLINWEIEFKKWCPSFKILTYFGNVYERREKRKGWSKTNAFHVCITSYRIVMQDSVPFRRKRWRYMILDEAHNIKNFKSKRWQLMLNFQSQRRLLLTGTPLQNDLMELWALMHFLMPYIFQSYSDFRDWFSTPLAGIIEGTKEYNEKLIGRLHKVLRPFILRRLKADVEKQLPQKYEHVVVCKLSRRQRFLYDDFMSQAKTKETLKSCNLMAVIGVLMSLRKVCNHPDLFETRPTISPFSCCPIPYETALVVTRALEKRRWRIGLADMEEWSAGDVEAVSRLRVKRDLIVDMDSIPPIPGGNPPRQKKSTVGKVAAERRRLWAAMRIERMVATNDVNHSLRIPRPLYGRDVRSAVTCPRTFESLRYIDDLSTSELYFSTTRVLWDIVRNPVSSLERNRALIEKFVFVVSRVKGRLGWAAQVQGEDVLRKVLNPYLDSVHDVVSRAAVTFPDKRLIQYDCGKLQVLESLLRKLKGENHRTLIFTQMTRMLDILEQFLTFHGYRYLRLDGATKIDERQNLMDLFNGDPRIFVFILSTRAGGIGVNLTGADTVIFYDSDWNPTMDNQAQDRCHRIGQTRDVHIYRLVSERTVEENILRRANEKRMLVDISIEGGNFNPDAFTQRSILDLFEGAGEGPSETMTGHQLEQAMCQAEEDVDVMAAKLLNEEKREEMKGDMEEWSDGEDGQRLLSQMSPIELWALGVRRDELGVVEADEVVEFESDKDTINVQRMIALKEEDELRAELEEDEMLFTNVRNFTLRKRDSSPSSDDAPKKRGRKPDPFRVPHVPVKSGRGRPRVYPPKNDRTDEFNIDWSSVTALIESLQLYNMTSLIQEVQFVDSLVSRKEEFVPSKLYTFREPAGGNSAFSTLNEILIDSPQSTSISLLNSSTTSHGGHPFVNNSKLHIRISSNDKKSSKPLSTPKFVNSDSGCERHNMSLRSHK